jgi:predicted PurR-regulated permease PerM
MNIETSKKFDVAWEAILKIAIGIICLYVLYNIRELLIWFVFAVVLSILFNPAIDFLQRRKIPRILSTIFIYVGFFGILSLLIYLIVPIFVHEIQQFITAFPQYFEKISPSLKGLGFEAFDNFGNFIQIFKSYVEAMGDNVFNSLIIFFGGISSTLFVIATAFFISLEQNAIEKTLMVLFPKRYETYALHLFERCEKRVTGWFAVRLLACLFIGVASYAAFLILNVKYPFTLALFAGVLNFVPYVGPLVTAAVLFFIVFPTEMVKAVFVLIVFMLIQQIENNVISPILMRKIVGLPPALVLLALAVGGQLWGFLGAIMVVPLLGIFYEFTREFLEKRKEKESVVV